MAVVDLRSWPEAGLLQALTPSGLTSDGQLAVSDVGAHQGEILARVLSHFSTDVHYLALEPNRDSYRVLCKARNEWARLGFQFETLMAAASLSAGTAPLYQANESAVARLLRPAFGVDERVASGDHRVLQVFAVDVVAVDDVTRERKSSQASLLKVDTGGYGPKALKGARNALDSSLVDVVLAKVLFVSYRDDQAFFWHLAQYLEDLGFSS